MALVNPNIAMSYRGVEIPNQMAQYAQMTQIQNAQQQNRLADMQMQEYARARTEEEGLRNYLAGADLAKPETRAGVMKFGKTGLAYGKALSEQETSAATLANVKSQTGEREFKLANDKLKHGWQSMGEAPTPQAAIEKLNLGVKSGYFTPEQAAAEAQKLEQITTPEQYKQYRVEKILGILDAKDQLAAMLPKVARQDIGGSIVNIQDNPALPGYGLPVAGAGIVKTPTIGERTAQGQLGLAQRKFAFEQANPGYELKEDADGNFYGVNKRTLQATPVMVGGAAPAAEAGLIGGVRGAPGAPVAGAAPVAGVPLRGKVKDTALTESQGNATAYGMRMKEANAILEPLEKAGRTNTGLISGAVGGTVGLIPFIGEKLEGVSGSVFNALPQILGGLSPEQQQVAQARINFITAILRKESGAAIGANEFATAEKNYFPKPGDDAAAIAQKQQARKTAIKAMEIQAGPGARQMGGAGVIPGASATNPLGLPGL